MKRLIPVLAAVCALTVSAQDTTATRRWTVDYIRSAVPGIVTAVVPSAYSSDWTVTYIAPANEVNVFNTNGTLVAIGDVVDFGTVTRLDGTSPSNPGAYRYRVVYRSSGSSASRTATVTANPDSDTVMIFMDGDVRVMTLERVPVAFTSAYGFLDMRSAPGIVSNVAPEIVSNVAPGIVDGKISATVPGIVDSKISDAVADFPTHRAVTNITRDVVAVTGRYVWDAEHSVCYRLHPHGGFLDLIAVTNINVTLPGNEAALQAIENEWRDR